VLTRFLFDDAGRIRRRHMGGVIVTLIVLALFGGTLAAFTPLWNGHGAIQSLWVLFSVFLLKMPLVVFLWWLIVRNKEWPGKPVVWDEAEIREILDYLTAEAERAVGLRDAEVRLRYLGGEAWHVADRADGPLKADAVGVALEIDRMLHELGGRRRV
jgi:hypothetical protein